MDLDTSTTSATINPVESNSKIPIEASTINRASCISQEMSNPAYAGYLVMIVTFFIFYLAEIVIDLNRKKIEGLLQGRGQRLRNWRKFNNTIISLIHAFLCSIGLIVSLYFYPSLRKDLVFDCYIFPYLLICFSAGYFAKDFATNLTRREEFNRSWRESSEILLHHFVCVMDMTISVNKMYYTGGLIFALLAELNNTFLHLRSILIGVGWPQTGPLFQTISLLNLLTNIIFRCLPNFFLAYRFIFNSPSGDSSLDQEIPLLDLSLIIFSLCLLMTYQSVMFFRICDRDLKRKRRNDAIKTK